MSHYTDPQWLKFRSEAMKKLWADPEMRKRIIEKQKQLGYRTYGDSLYSNRKTKTS